MKTIRAKSTMLWMAFQISIGATANSILGTFIASDPSVELYVGYASLGAMVSASLYDEETHDLTVLKRLASVASAVTASALFTLVAHLSLL